MIIINISIPKMYISYWLTWSFNIRRLSFERKTKMSVNSLLERQLRRYFNRKDLVLKCERTRPRLLRSCHEPDDKCNHYLQINSPNHTVSHCHTYWGQTNNLNMILLLTGPLKHIAISILLIRHCTSYAYRFLRDSINVFLTAIIKSAHLTADW